MLTSSGIIRSRFITVPPSSRTVMFEQDTDPFMSSHLLHVEPHELSQTLSSHFQ
jgi:hypothetical protein